MPVQKYNIVWIGPGGRRVEVLRQASAEKVMNWMANGRWVWPNGKLMAMCAETRRPLTMPVPVGNVN